MTFSNHWSSQRQVSDVYNGEATPRSGDRSDIHPANKSTSDAAGSYLRPGATSSGLLRRRSTAILQKFTGHDSDYEERHSSQRPSLRTVQTDASTQQSHDRPKLGRATSSKGRVPSLRSSTIRGVASPAAATESDKLKARASVVSTMSYKERVSLLRRQSREIFEHVEREFGRYTR